MDILIEKDDLLYKKIIEEYELNIKYIKYVKESSSLYIDTGKKVFLLENIDDTINHVISTAGIYEHLNNKGFYNLLRIYKTKNGKYYMLYDKKIYILLDYEHHKLDLSKYPDKAIRLLGRFHKKAVGYLPPSGGKCKSNWGKWIEKYIKESKLLKKYMNEVLNKEEKTEFEDIFLSECHMYIDRMDKAIEILKNNNYVQAIEDSMKRHQLCICDFKQSNLYIKDKKVYIKSLDKCKYDIVEKDIADFLEEMLKASPEMKLEELVRLISLYEKENKLSKNSVNIISAFIIYPSSYEKVCSRYYKGKDKWDDKEYISKLNEARLFDNKKMELFICLNYKK